MKWIKIKNKRVWSLISLIMCLMVWQLISVSEAGAVFASPEKTLMAFITMAKSGAIWVHIGYSLFRVKHRFLRVYVSYYNHWPPLFPLHS